MATQQALGYEGEVVPPISFGDTSVAAYATHPKAGKLVRLKAIAKNITNHLSNLDARQLQLFIESTPNIDEVITCLGKDMIEVIISKVPNINDLLPNLKPTTIGKIASNLCAEILRTVEVKPHGMCDGYGYGWQEMGDREDNAAPTNPKPTCTGSRLSKLTDNLHTLKDVSIDQPMDMLLSTQPDCTASPLSTWKGNLARVQDVLIEGLLEKLELGGAMPSIFVANAGLWKRRGGKEDEKVEEEEKEEVERQTTPPLSCQC
ncbi:hypothetical protein ECG_07465 [Echinococcus granulosus]|nr:hypothetical protein ECG_07465 [Echinococcus granulosus]